MVRRSSTENILTAVAAQAPFKEQHKALWVFTQRDSADYLQPLAVTSRYVGQFANPVHLNVKRLAGRTTAVSLRLSVMGARPGLVRAAVSGDLLHLCGRLDDHQNCTDRFCGIPIGDQGPSDLTDYSRNVTISLPPFLLNGGLIRLPSGPLLATEFRNSTFLNL